MDLKFLGGLYTLTRKYAGQKGLYRSLCTNLSRFSCLCSFIGRQLRDRTSSRIAYLPTTKLAPAFVNAVHSALVQLCFS